MARLAVLVPAEALVPGLGLVDAPPVAGAEVVALAGVPVLALPLAPTIAAQVQAPHP